MDDPVDELAIIERLRAGDEATFGELVRRHHQAMVHFAQSFVPSRAIAEEVAQDAWLGVIKGIDRFEGRSSLRTWIFRIVANIARTRGEREQRMITVGDQGDDAASVPPGRFAGATAVASGASRRRRGVSSPTNNCWLGAPANGSPISRPGFPTTSGGCLSFVTSKA